MPERKTLGRISAITDCDTGLHSIGEINGGLDREMTRQHIERHGSEGLLNTLAHMTHLVVDEQRRIDNDKGCGASNAGTLVDAGKAADNVITPD